VSVQKKCADIFFAIINGIIILVEEDIQAYLEGTLIFRDGNSEIM